MIHTPVSDTAATYVFQPGDVTYAIWEPENIKYQFVAEIAEQERASESG